MRLAPRRQRRRGLGLDRLLATVAVDDDAVQVQALVGRRPLVSDEGSELSRVVVLLGRRDGLLPGVAVAVRARRQIERVGERVAGQRGDHLDRHAHRGLAALLDAVVPVTARGIGQHVRVPRDERREEAHVVGVVGDDEEVERTRQLHLQPGRGGHLLAAREAIGVLGREPGPEGAGVEGVPRVQMGVSPEHLGREVSPRPRRVVIARREMTLTLALAGPDVLGRSDGGREQKQR